MLPINVQAKNDFPANIKYVLLREMFYPFSIFHQIQRSNNYHIFFTFTFSHYGYPISPKCKAYDFEQFSLYSALWCFNKFPGQNIPFYIRLVLLMTGLLHHITCHLSINSFSCQLCISCQIQLLETKFWILDICVMLHPIRS